MTELEKLYERKAKLKKRVSAFFDEDDKLNFADLEYQALLSELKDVEKEILLLK